MGTSDINRRSFLKLAAAGTTGMVLTSSMKIKGATLGTADNPYVFPNIWTNGKELNPDIPNMRVVCCHDPKMITADVSLPYAGSVPVAKYVAAQQKVIDTNRVSANMDEMAKSLAQKSTADEAWKAIFKKPDTKTWAQVKVAMKVNKTSATCEARPAVISKLCDVLHGFGVPYGNIILFDGHAYGGGNDVPAVYDQFLGNGLPADTVISQNMGSAGTGMGGEVTATISGVAGYGSPTYLCDGTIDILINMAVNKGQNVQCAGFVAATKNHFGTFLPPVINHDDYNALIGLICNISKSSAIIGGTPVRQQLVVVDSLWTQIFGPCEVSDSAIQRTDCLVMGTFSPAVDYLVAKKVRVEMMSVNTKKDPGQQVLFPVDPTQLALYCTLFGYAETDPQWVLVPPAGSATLTGFSHVSGSGRNTISVTLDNPGYRKVTAYFPVSSSEVNSLRADIYDLTGKSVRNLGVISNGSVSWDAHDASGRTVSPGTYAIRVVSATRQYAGKITLSK